MELRGSLTKAMGFLFRHLMPTMILPVLGTTISDIWLKQDISEFIPWIFTIACACEWSFMTAMTSQRLLQHRNYQHALHQYQQKLPHPSPLISTCCIRSLAMLQNRSRRARPQRLLKFQTQHQAQLTHSQKCQGTSQLIQHMDGRIIHLLTGQWLEKWF